MKMNGKKGSRLVLRLASVLLIAVLLCGMGLPAAAEGEPVSTDPVNTEQLSGETLVEDTALTVESRTIGGVSVLAENNITIYKDGTTTLNGSGNSWQNHNWSSSNNSVVEITGTSNSKANIKGVSAGTATITHTYGRNTETFNITVILAEKTTQFIPNIENAEVLFVHYTSNDSLNDINFEEVNGNFSSEYNVNDNNYWLFFVKPNDNYLLTGLGADGAGNIYSVDGPYGANAGYPLISELAAQAKEMGYVGLFGYSRSSGSSLLDEISFIVRCQSPEIEVSAVSNKAENVKPGEELTFTVTIRPGTTGTGKDKVTDVEVNTITVNGQAVNYSEIINNGDGTYTTTVQYTATADDCASGSVKLEVEAAVSYEGTLVVTDNQELGSVATITKTATTECRIAPKNRVTYTHTYDTQFAQYPDEIIGNPVDSTDYYSGEQVTVDTTYPDKGEVIDSVNGGKWTFDGWYLGEDKVTTATMTEEGLTFTGVWKFTPVTYTVTVTKTVNGNMGDRDKSFDFSYQINDGTAESFQLKHGEVKEIPVRLGQKLTVTENSTGYDVYINGTQESSKTMIVNENTEIAFTNTKNVNIDTGVSLDALPYVLLLGGMAVLGGTLLLRRREDRA